MSDEGYALKYGNAASLQACALLHNTARLHLLDVRAMLKLPLPSAGITAGCNFAAAHVLLNVLSGLSRLLEPGHGNSGRAFKSFVRRRYPWSLEGPMALTKLRGTNALYDKFRNGFAHDLGLQLDNAPTTRPGRRVRVRSRLPLMAPRIAVAKKPSLSDSELFELDDVIGRPAWLNPTVSKDAAAALVVDVPALYWGVRRLIFDYSNDARSVRSLEHMIKRTVSRRMKANLIETFTGT